MKRVAWVSLAVGVAVLLAAALALVPVDSLSSGPAVAEAVPVATTAADDAVQRALRAGKPTVAEFGANSCVQCREMKVVLDALRRTHNERITIVNVDLIAHKEADYIRRYGIQLMPTQIFYDAQGRESSRHLGKISGEEILARLQVSAQAGSPQ